LQTRKRFLEEKPIDIFQHNSVSFVPTCLKRLGIGNWAGENANQMLTVLLNFNRIFNKVGFAQKKIV